MSEKPNFLTDFTDAVSLLERIVPLFQEEGHPGRACLRTGWIDKGAVENWRAIVVDLRKRLNVESCVCPDDNTRLGNCPIHGWTPPNG